MRRRAFTKTELAVVVGILMIPLACLGVFAPLELVLRLAFGWINFLRTVGSRIRLDIESTLVFCASVAALTIGLHWFLAWLSRTSRVPAADEQAPPRWRPRWTLAVVAILLMMFVAGTAMIGIIHQVTWLVTATQSMFEGSGPREAAQRMASTNNLRQIAIGLHNYHDVYQHFPPGMSADQGGRARHGWLTSALPYFSISAETIDLDKPWNHAVNKTSFSVPVPLFQMPRPDLPKYDERGYALAHYAGNVHIVGGPQPIAMSDISDGTSSTILIGEAAGNYKPWGHPHNWRDPAIGINTSSDGFGGPWTGGGAQFALADGSVRYLNKEIDPAILRALATPRGNEKLPDDF